MTRWTEAKKALVAAAALVVACGGETKTKDGAGAVGTAGAAGSGGTAGSGQAGMSGASGTSGSAGDGGTGGSAPALSFRKLVLSTEFYCEGANFGDFNRDGIGDVVAGPRYWAGPDFATPTPIYDGPVAPIDYYSDNFFAWARDLSGDGYDDVLYVGFPGASAYWYENPAGGDAAAWARHDVVPSVGNESPDYADVTGDGEPELVFIEMQPDLMSGRYGYAGPGTDPREPWTFHPLSPLGVYSHFTHGMGTGDVNGDGRSDLIETTGVWTQPASLTGDPLWQKSAHVLGQGGGQMVADDVDGDGDADVVTTLNAHGYGLSWFENDGGEFVEHNIVPATDPAGSGVVMHEPHALAMADIDGNGLLDIVTGERHWGHVAAGADFLAPARLFWFEARREGRAVTFVPHLVDDQSGVGTQVVAGDVNDDDLVDIVLANKKGAFLFLQERE